jgi:uncharacterized oxidoreductase
MKMPLLSAEHLRNIGISILAAMGAPRESAETVADMLVNANLTGHDSHGIVYLIRYADRIKRGIIDPKAKPKVVKETATTALVDGHWTFGQVTAKKTMEIAIEKARRNHISAVGAFNCNHICRLGGYTMMAAEQDMIGFLFANVVHPNVQPYGGDAGAFGTNPLSIAIPAGDMRPFLLDFATSAVAEGRVTLAAIKGEKIPLGWIVDKDGNPTDNPDDLYPPGAVRKEDCGRLLTIGAQGPGQGHKGYCLSILMDILGGVLTGSGSVLDEIRYDSQNGILAVVMNIDGFIPLSVFKKKMDSLFKGVHGIPVADGFQYDHVLVPGEPEWKMQEKRFRAGIEVAEPAWQEIIELAKELGLDLKDLGG